MAEVCTLAMLSGLTRAIRSVKNLQAEMTVTRSVAAGFGRHGMPSPDSYDTGTALGQDGSDRSRDLATLTFNLRGHGVCG